MNCEVDVASQCLGINYLILKVTILKEKYQEQP